jgi:hypothetical protein
MSDIVMILTIMFTLMLHMHVPIRNMYMFSIDGNPCVAISSEYTRFCSQISSVLVPFRNSYLRCLCNNKNDIALKLI